MKLQDLTKDELIYLLQRECNYEPMGTELEKTIYYYRYLKNDEKASDMLMKLVELHNKLTEVVLRHKDASEKEEIEDLLRHLKKFDNLQEKYNKLEEEMEKYKKESDKNYGLYLNANGM